MLIPDKTHLSNTPFPTFVGFLVCDPLSLTGTFCMCMGEKDFPEWEQFICGYTIEEIVLPSTPSNH